MDTLTLLQRLLPLVWPLLVSGLFLAAVPDLMRPGLFFGRTVDPGFKNSDVARAIRRRYSIAVGATTVIVVGLVTMAELAAAGVWVAPIGLVGLARDAAILRRISWLLQALVAVWAFARANRAARAHALPRESIVRIEVSTRREAPSPLLAAAVATPLVSLGVLALWTVFHWHAIPARVPIHWGFGRPDRWMTTTPGRVAALLLLATVTCVLPAVLAWGVLYGSRHVATSGKAAGRERLFRTLTVTLLVTAEYFTVVPVWAGLLAATTKVMMLWELVLPLLILTLVGSLVLIGQGGSRGLGRREAGSRGDRTEDRNWVWGLIYFNRADPAFLVEKRFGVGYSFNFGHPLAWALLALILAVPLLGHLL